MKKIHLKNFEIQKIQKFWIFLDLVFGFGFGFGFQNPKNFGFRCLGLTDKLFGSQIPAKNSFKFFFDSGPGSRRQILLQ